MVHPYDAGSLLRLELTQREESGYDVSAVEAEVDKVSASADDRGVDAAWEMLGALPRRSDWEYEEPSRRDEIEACLTPITSISPSTPSTLDDKILGAWLGRCAGNNLGKPVENGAHWTRARIRDYLTKAGAYPLTDYVPLLNPMPDGFQLRESWNETTRGSINGVARDDDIDYTILGLFLLETHGADLSATHVADEWLDRLPYTQTYTAERVAYRNLVNGISPEEAGERRNPYREWIGAQIRGDIFGYTHPGKPREAALAAHADAYLSHRGNGIYGEMWAAALIAAAFTAEGAYAAVLESQHHIPPNSRLAEALRMVIAAYDADLSWDTALDEIMQTYGHYDWVHTINNAAVLTAGLLWGDGDFTRSIALTVQAGLDTDSNGATAGSFAGALNGAARVPAHWVDPFHDTVRSSIRGFDGSRISDLADRTRSAASSD